MQAPQCLIFGPFQLDRRDKRLWRGPEAIPLPPKTFVVLCCLVMQAGQLVTKEALLETIWPTTVGSESSLMVAIRTLCRVLGDPARTPRFIETVHGRGYRFVAPVSTLVAPSETGEEAPRRVSSSTFRRPPHFVGRDAALAQELVHPFSLAYTMCFAGMLDQLCRDVQVAQARATAAMALCTEQGFALYLARGIILQGWAMAEQGQGAAGLAQMHQGLVAYQATGAAVFRPYYLAFLAEAYGTRRQAGEGLALLGEALAVVHQTGERFYEAEIYRLKGELLLAHSAENRGKAEGCFQQALLVARHQRAQSSQLRAAMSLSRLWQHQGKRAAAYGLLALAYGWFSEGFDTSDLQEARTLLEALS
jgi:DNA-binding winged helix-turn-helix (wHTH) protein